MPLTRRAFTTGLASLLGLLAWPWKWREPNVYQVPQGMKAHIRGLHGDCIIMDDPLAAYSGPSFGPLDPEVLARELDDLMWSVDMDPPIPTHFQGITKRLT